MLALCSIVLLDIFRCIRPTVRELLLFLEFG